MLQGGDSLQEFLFIVGKRDVVTGCYYLRNQFGINYSLDIQGLS